MKQRPALLQALPDTTVLAYYIVAKANGSSFFPQTLDICRRASLNFHTAFAELT